MDSNIAIKVESLSKSFKLPHERSSTLKSAIVHFARRNRGYEIQHVLKDLSFEIKKGEFFGIVGRNGSGKSTLLKLLAGIYSPSGGNVVINGKLTPFIELGVGFNPELTGRENVYLNGALLGFSRKEMSAMYSDIVEFAELEKFMDQKLKNYSSGMQVRLAFSITIRANTDILLIDEVLAVGDLSFQEKCFAYFKEVKKSGKTVILVTHDMGNVERFCDKVLIIDKGINRAEVVDIPTAIGIYNRLNHEIVKDIVAESGGVLERDISKANVYVKKVELLDEHNKASRAIDYSSKLTVRIHIGSRLDSPEPIVVGLAFYDSDDIDLAGPNSRKYPINSSVGTVEYNLSSVPFNNGEYRLAVGIFDETVKQQYDYLDDAARFYVNTSEVIYGKIGLEGKWYA